MMEITKHAQERYAERIMGRSEQVEINRYITENAQKIKDDINKMIEYGEPIFHGVQKGVKKDAKFVGEKVDVFVSGCWVILVSTSKNQVITLYKVDLGVDEEFNKMYVSKMMEKIKDAQNNQAKVQEEVNNQNNEYRNMVAELEASISEMKQQLANMTKLIEGYNEVISNNAVKVSLEEQKVADIVNKLIGKKEF